MTATTIRSTALRTPRFDKLGVLIALIGLVALFSPFVLARVNRIVAGDNLPISAALPLLEAVLLYAIIGGGLVVALFKTPTLLRLIVSFLVLAALFVLVGRAGVFLTPEGNTIARVSPTTGFWVQVFAFSLMAADALTRLRLSPWARIGILLLVSAGIAALLFSGGWNQLSLLKEYANQSGTFWAQGRTHIFLAFGSLAVAAIVGIPLGIWGHRQPRLRAGLLNVLNIIQTIPSIALFGLLIAPLAWIGANVPGASALGIAGIGIWPAMVALFVYSLLPMVANTIVGLQSVPEAANDAARGMGMTDNQRLFGVELPLAFPVILTGIRIVLVQNIGLATIAALIGGGGFGVFVFQGIGQTAMDLVLLGALPTVALAFAAAVILDAVVEMVEGSNRNPGSSA